jgi:hypothetical protein
MDLFEPLVPREKLHKTFSYVMESRAHPAARRLLQKTFESLPKPDGNFILDFQTSGFDARIWELYLAAFFRSVRLSIAQPYDRPDFLLSSSTGEVWVEATTANPTQGIQGGAAEDHWSEQETIAIKLGSALYSKLKKRYWELPHVQGKPLVIAISDFHDDNPIRSSSHALERYLYAVHVQLTSGSGTSVEDYALQEIEHHKVGTKEIPAGFFFEPEADQISAVLFSNAGTVAKFNRTGLQSGSYDKVKALRMGLLYDPDPTATMPQPFAYVVGDRQEMWGEEVVLFHNPNAQIPVPHGFFGDVVEVQMHNGDYSHSITEFHPMISITEVRSGDRDQMREAEGYLRARGAEWIEQFKNHRPDMDRLVKDVHQQWKAD